MCRIASLFFYRGWKEACQATSAISTTSRRELSSNFFIKFFFFLQEKTPKEIHAILTETLGEHAPSYATVKNWVAKVKRDDLSTCAAPRSGWLKTVTTPQIIDQIHELILEDRRISAKSIAEQLGKSRETEQESIEWRHRVSPCPEKFGVQKSSGNFSLRSLG